MGRLIIQILSSSIKYIARNVNELGLRRTTFLVIWWLASVSCNGFVFEYPIVESFYATSLDTLTVREFLRKYKPSLESPDTVDVNVEDQVFFGKRFLYAVGPSTQFVKRRVELHLRGDYKFDLYELKISEDFVPEQADAEYLDESTFALHITGDWRVRGDTLLLYEDQSLKCKLPETIMDFNLKETSIQNWNDYLPIYRTIIESDPMHIYSHLPENVSGFIIKEDRSVLEGIGTHQMFILSSRFFDMLKDKNSKRRNKKSKGIISAEALHKVYEEQLDGFVAGERE